MTNSTTRAATTELEAFEQWEKDAANLTPFAAWQARAAVASAGALRADGGKGEAVDLIRQWIRDNETSLNAREFYRIDASLDRLAMQIAMKDTAPQAECAPRAPEVWQLAQIKARPDYCDRGVTGTCFKQAGVSGVCCVTGCFHDEELQRAHDSWKQAGAPRAIEQAVNKGARND